MAKFNEYPVKATPEDADTLMLYDAASKTNKLSPFSGIWNWMVNKLTNAVINNLQTSNKTVVGALNELNSNLTAKAYAYTPSFSWSKGTVNPTVENITAYFSQYGKVCFAYVRYNITDLGTFDKESFLEITLPSGINSLVHSTSLVSPYQIVERNTSLGVRITRTKVIIVDGVVGNYSAEYIKKGYQGFSVFFIAK